MEKNTLEEEMALRRKEAKEKRRGKRERSYGREMMPNQLLSVEGCLVRGL